MQAETYKLFVSGDGSGVGKTTCCIGLLDYIKKEWIGKHQSIDEVAYIKPATQCTDVQLLWKYCAKEDILFRGIGPIHFRTGFTQFCLRENEDPEELLMKISDAMEQMTDQIIAKRNSQEKCRILFIIDGIGYPAVGSICGINNGTVAKFLNAPVLLISKCCPFYSLGNTIDTFERNCIFLDHYIPVLGTIFNKYIPLENREDEKLDEHRVALAKDLKSDVKLYFEKRRKDKYLYGILDSTVPKQDSKIHVTPSFTNLTQTLQKDVCIPSYLARTEAVSKHPDMYSFTPQEEQFVNHFLNQFHSSIQIEQIILDVLQYYQK